LADGDALESDLYVATADGGMKQRLTRTPGVEEFPRWWACDQIDVHRTTLTKPVREERVRLVLATPQGMLDRSTATLGEVYEPTGRSSPCPSRRHVSACPVRGPLTGYLVDLVVLEPPLPRRPRHRCRPYVRTRIHEGPHTNPQAPCYPGTLWWRRGEIITGQRPAPVDGEHYQTKQAISVHHSGEALYLTNRCPWEFATNPTP